MEGANAAVLTILSFGFILAVITWLTILPVTGVLYYLGFLH